MEVPHYLSQFNKDISQSLSHCDTHTHTCTHVIMSCHVKLSVEGFHPSNRPAFTTPWNTTDISMCLPQAPSPFWIVWDRHEKGAHSWLKAFCGLAGHMKEKCKNFLRLFEGSCLQMEIFRRQLLEFCTGTFTNEGAQKTTDVLHC